MKTMSKFTQILLILALLAGMFGLQPAQPARAASIVVNSSIDDDIFNTFANGTCELREAIINANNDDQSGSTDCAAGSGADVITFADDYTITLYSQLPTIDSNITITGRGISNTIIQANANPNEATYRVFLVDGDPLTLNHLTVRHGRCVDACGDGSNTSGGGIFVWGGILNLNNSAVLNNSASNWGGGIMLSGGEIHANNSSIAFNTAELGGGIGSSGVAGWIDISNSSIIANSASTMGGVHVNSPVTLTMVNSTVSNNIATTTNPAGIQNDGIATITNSTIVSNDGNGLFASGIVNGSNSLTLYNTIVANNLDGDDCSNVGTLTANSFNLDSDGSCGDATTKTSGELNLGGVGDHGGPTYTVPLLPGSHAIDAGDPATCTAADQRGVPRSSDGDKNGSVRCDVGAFEVAVMNAKSAAKQDGWVLESDEFSGVGGTQNAGGKTFNIGDDALNRQYRAILSFNTAALPDNAIINTVTLKFKRKGVTGGGNPVTTFKGFLADIKKGNFGASALELADFNTAGNKTLGAFKPTPVSGWYTLNLTGGKNQINKTGVTQIRLRFKLDDNNNAVANFLIIHSGNASAASRPQLIVEYDVP